MIGSSNDRYDWLALYLVKGLGNVGARNLLGRFGGPKAIFEASFASLRAVEGVGDRTARSIVSREFALDPEQEFLRLEKIGARILAFSDADYPPQLREMHDAPIVLFFRGKPISKERALVAIVGSRNATHYGLRSAERIGAELARCGVGVVSGMARGIDSASHWGCLREGGYTIAVLGTGLNVVYPSGNEKLYGQILEKGTVLTEFPLGTPPEPRNFPIRNRIISGLSRGVVVVEATRRSGSLITASMALEQGRDVFAVPGSVDSFKSAGTHLLIKQGAKLVENASDILEDLGFGGAGSTVQEPAGGQGRLEGALDEREARIYALLGEYPLQVDEIVRMADMEAGEVLSLLLRLELHGLVRQLPGKIFVR
jgi:DNA processing protein